MIMIFVKLKILEIAHMLGNLVRNCGQLPLLLFFTPIISYASLEQDQVKTLNTIIDKDDKVKSIYEGACSEKKFKFVAIVDTADPSQSSPATSRGECLIEKVGAQKLEKLAQQYIVAKETKKINDNVNNIKKSSRNNPALLKLEEYLKKKLQESLYGKKSEGSDRKKNIVNQKVFFDLYESQVGKNVIGSLSSYCIETNADENFVIPDEESDRKALREKNLDALAIQDENGNIAAYGAWGRCIVNIQKVCLKTDISDYQRGRACNVTHYIKAMRQNLIAVKELKTAMDERLSTDQVTMQESTIKGAAFTERKVNLGGDKQTDKLTSITSNEFVNTSGYGDAQKQMQEDFEKKCEKKNDEKECLKYINNKEQKDKLAKLADELELKRGLIEKKLEKMSAKEKKKLLKDQGYSDAEIKVAIAKDNSTQIILDKYKKEKEGILKGIRKRMADLSIQGDKFNQQQDKDAIAKVKEELATNLDRNKDIIHFNNVISGYLQVGKGKDAKKNLATMHREIEDSAFDPKNNKGRKTASTTKNNKVITGDDNAESKAKKISAIARFNKLSDLVKKQKKNKVKAGQGILTVGDINKHIVNFAKPPDEDKDEEESVEEVPAGAN